MFGDDDEAAGEDLVNLDASLVPAVPSPSKKRKQNIDVLRMFVMMFCMRILLLCTG